MDSKEARLRYLDGVKQVSTEEHEGRLEDIKAAILDSEKTRPGHLFFTEKLADFSQAIKSKEKENVLREVLMGMFQHPLYVEGFFDSMEKLTALSDKNAEGAQVIQDELRRNLEKIIKKDRIGVTQEHTDVMDRWLELYTNSERYRPVISELLRLSIDTGKSELLQAQRKHVVAESILRASDFEVVKAGLKILMMDTDILPETDGNIDRHLAGLISQDDEILKLHLDIDGAIDFIGRNFLPEEFVRFRQKLTAFSNKVHQKGDQPKEKSKFLERSSALKTTEKGRQILHFHDFVNDPKVRAKSNFDGKVYPFSLIMDLTQITSARRLLNERLAAEIRDKAGINLRRVYNPSQGELVEELPQDYEETRRLVVSWFQKAGGWPEIADEIAFETMQLLFPKLEESTRQRISERVEGLRESLKHELRYLVSPRGDRIIIEDEFLNSLSIHEISFSPRDSAVDLDVKIKIGNYSLCCRLDGYYMLRHALEEGDVSLRVSLDTNLVLEELILSQLQKLLCADKEAHRGGKGGETDGAAHSSTVRRAHLRKLPKGQSFTTDQACKIFEKYGIDLWQINAQLGLDRDAGTYTCVKAIEAGSDTGSEPVKTVIQNGSQLDSIFF